MSRWVGLSVTVSSAQPRQMPISRQGTNWVEMLDGKQIRALVSGSDFHSVVTISGQSFRTHSKMIGSQFLKGSCLGFFFFFSNLKIQPPMRIQHPIIHQPCGAGDLCRDYDISSNPSCGKSSHVKGKEAWSRAFRWKLLEATGFDGYLRSKVCK